MDGDYTYPTPTTMAMTQIGYDRFHDDEIFGVYSKTEKCIMICLYPYEIGVEANIRDIVDGAQTLKATKTDEELWQIRNELIIN